MINNKYNPSEIEEKWYQEWEKNKIFLQQEQVNHIAL